MSTPEPVTHVHPLAKYETVVNSGQAALRALLTMNGGATVSFLTFIGHLWQRGTLPRESFHVLVDALQFFIYGTFFAVLAYGTIFLTNCLSSVDWHRSSNAMFVVTVLCGFASIFCFLAASWRAVEGFQSATTVLPT